MTKAEAGQLSERMAAVIREWKPELTVSVVECLLHRFEVRVRVEFESEARPWNDGE